MKLQVCVRRSIGASLDDGLRVHGLLQISGQLKGAQRFGMGDRIACEKTHRRVVAGTGIRRMYMLTRVHPRQASQLWTLV